MSCASILSDAAINSDAVPDAADAIAGMVFVPAGPFVMGSDPSQTQPSEQPKHMVNLSAYFIDAHEVTNAEWRACVTGGGCTEPTSRNSNTRTNYYTNGQYDGYPVIYVTWQQAGAYCLWAGKRLPTEAEWEKAARGGCEIVPPSTCGPEDERLYPWGSAAPTCGLANWGNSGAYCGTADTDVVGSRSPAGDSPYGAQDMAGNVFEWVADFYSPDYSWCSQGCNDPLGPASGTSRVQRSGSWGNFEAFKFRTTFRFGVVNAASNMGLRCARSP